MQYQEWGEDYLAEAERIKQHIETIRAGWRDKSPDEKLSVNRRTNLLYEMYLECRHTGRLLSARGQGHAE